MLAGYVLVEMAGGRYDEYFGTDSGSDLGTTDQEDDGTLQDHEEPLARDPPQEDYPHAPNKDYDPKVSSGHLEDRSSQARTVNLAETPGTSSQDNSSFLEEGCLCLISLLSSFLSFAITQFLHT